jgi:hypothetical protein
MRVALWRGSGECGSERCCLGVVGRAGPCVGGVIGRSMGSSIFLTSSSLPVESAGEGAHKGSSGAAMLGTAAAGKKGIGIGELSRGISVPCWEGKQLSSNITSLDSLTEWVCLSQSRYPFEPGSYPTSVTSIAFASNLRHLSAGMCIYALHLKMRK